MSDLDFDPRQVGHDGRCDHDGSCNRAATKAVLSAVAPECACGGCGWDGAPAAAVAFVCDAHVAAEPVAMREHAEHNASGMTGVAAVLWRALLDSYPEPVTLR